MTRASPRKSTRKSPRTLRTPPSSHRLQVIKDIDVACKDIHAVTSLIEKKMDKLRSGKYIPGPTGTVVVLKHLANSIAFIATRLENNDMPGHVRKDRKGRVAFSIHDLSS